uniref:Uncharacterized protein n=1 Tax=uncultured prokaryote TaxID=198431 RepID=A0A0H5Q569_9ZZZZ|nr:hypothetical protein [uncultured prokaryote]
MPLFRHVASGASPGEQWTFTLHTTGAGDLTSAQATWESATAALWVDQLDALISTDVVMTEVTTASLDEGTGGQISRLGTGVDYPGVSESEMLPFQCALVISTRSALATRSGRGRFYLPPIAEGNTVGGRLSSTAQAAVVTAGSQFFAALATGGLEPVILNRSTLAQTTITQFDVGDIIDTQRRRRNGLIEARTTASV